MNSKQPVICLSSSSPSDFLFYTIVIFLTLTRIPVSCGGGNETDHLALLKIKSMITQDPYGALSSWNSSLHFCDWSGVTCGKRHKRVVRVVLQFKGLEGSLSSHVGNLSFLHVLSLFNNSIQGVIPRELGYLSRLQLLYLGHNKFNGVIPANISRCSNLERIDLSENELVGSIPKDISILSKLTILSLHNNKLVGGVPPSLGNLTSIEELRLSENPLGGGIPDTLGHYKCIRKFKIVHFNLFGIIPYSLYNNSCLDDLSLSTNHLTGSLPLTLGVMLPNLVGLYLMNNKLSGPLPPSISNCSKLEDLQLINNTFSGKLTVDFARLRYIYDICLGQNLFGSKDTDEMKFVDSLINCTRLQFLDLGKCKFKGELPISIGNFSNQLQYRYLEVNQLHGKLPRSIGNLVSLKLLELDVSYNNLSGQIPRFLERLQYLNLSYNDFEGEVPMLGVFANVSAFSVLGNSRLCGGLVELKLPKCNETNGHNKKLRLVVIFSLIVFATFIVICLLYAWCKKKNKRQPSQSSTSRRFLKVSYKQLLKATDGFSDANLIGKGGFSSVYKGILGEGDDTFVAVKVLHLQNRGAQSSFMRECEAWRNLRHRNLLKIITSCSSIDFQGNDFKALVYEFMPNGNLHDWLHSSEKSTSRLNLVQIINILMDVASALGYIHNQCIPAVVHGDLKPSNILLDDDMVAHVGDFGLARVLGTSYLNSTTGIRGTIGYAAPEYGLGHEMTSSGDIYSFGILILEMVTGKRPTDDIFNEDLTFHKFASMAIRDHVMECIDVRLLNVYQEDEIFMQNTEENVKKIEECLALIVNIGVLCTVDSPLERMDIKKVIHELQHILDTLQNI